MKRRNLAYTLTLITLVISELFFITGCKKKPDAPTLTTTVISSITINTASSGGTISSDGGAEVTAKGICWGTSKSSTITGSHTTDGLGTGNFTSSITGLTPNTLYYVRAYATNSAGTGYGNEISFSTNPIAVAALTTSTITSITPTSALSGGTISADGGGEITSRGVCWNTSVNPTTANSKSSDGTGTGSFTSSMSALQPGSTYYVKAYAVNVAGTAYGNELTFTASATTATLTTTSVTSITINGGSSGGNITSDGGAAVTARGVCWSTTSGPIITGSHTTNGSGTGSFTSSLSGLSANTLYYVRAFATNSAGTSYGNEVSFTTNPVLLATIVTTAATSVTSTTAISGGNITADGGGSVTARGVCWSVSLNPTTSNSKTTDGSGTGSFISNISGSQPGTLYHIRAYATNSAGTAYGDDMTFTTTAAVPTVTTSSVTSITQTTATSGGNVTASGGASVTARGVCWAISTNPTISGSHTSDGGGTGSFSSSLTGLTANTTYYVRAYATNSAGTAYGSEVSFTAIQVTLATLTTTSVSSVTTNSATSGGNITSDGGANVTSRGICWSTSTSPTTGDPHVNNGTGTGSFSGNLTGLSQGTTYYVRAFATNSAGTAYGNQISFTASITDIEGNVYKTILIGSQIWMAENLATTAYNDNTIIPNVTDTAAWRLLATPAYCWFNNDIANKGLYGAMYNWYTINTGKLCPTGWHVPSDDEYKTLELYLGMSSGVLDVWGWRGTNQGAQMKSTSGWLSNGNGTNTSGFTALPGGYRYAKDGKFYTLGLLTYWWTSTMNGIDQAWYRRLDGTNSDVYRASTSIKGGKYIRCVKN